jgi:SHS2 domain-containing protein
MPGKKYEILEHKADLKIRAFGKTKKEIFENAMIGMFESANYQPTTYDERFTTKIKVSSLDLPSLLVDFLSEVLYLVETKKLVFEKIKFQKFSENEIRAILIGRPLKMIGVQIKGVTYHDLDIHQKNGKWQATVLFDI